MEYTKKELEEMIEKNGGSLDLSGTQITSLPDNLTVGGWLYLSGTKITSLPDNLTVGGSLYLSGTKITSLPDNLTVGSWLDLRGTQITSLPDNLTVGGWLYLRDKEIYRNDLINGDYKENEWLYTDGILTHISSKKQFGKYTYFKGKIKGKNVIFDGTNYAHCKDFKSGVSDLEFKALKDRGAEQFKDLTIDSVIDKDKAIVMYRIITGACQQGTQQFLDSLKEIKDSYKISEIIELTKGKYGSETFAKFFTNKSE